MNLIHVVPKIDQEAAGPSYTVPRLCQSLSQIGNHVQLSCLAAGENISGFELDLHVEWPILKKFEVSFSLVKSLYFKSKIVDIIHNHSLWSMVNVASGWVVPGRHAKLVTSPRGTLSPWALQHNKHVKRLLWPLQSRALSHADLIHATSIDEYYEIRNAGFTAPVAIIPNGIDLPTLTSMPVFSEDGYRTLLFLSRIHPKKGIDRLLKSWSVLQDKYPNWKLVIAGRGESTHVTEVMKMSEHLNLKRVSFPGPLYGKEKAHAYMQADLFVLPTHSENFGMVVAEALAHGCPAVVSRGAPWSGLESENCGWWVDNSVPILVTTLDAAMRLPPDQLFAMGNRGRAWMERDFGWAAIAKKMNTAYCWLLTGGECPAWVRMDT